MGRSDSKMDEPSLSPKYHKAKMDGYLKSYLFNPTTYQLSVAQARSMVEAHCGREEHQEVRPWNSSGNQKEASERYKQVKSNIELALTLIINHNCTDKTFTSMVNALLCVLCVIFVCIWLTCCKFRWFLLRSSSWKTLFWSARGMVTTRWTGRK